MQRKMKKKGLATLKWWLSDQKRPQATKSDQKRPKATKSDQKRPKATKISKMAVQSSLEATSNRTFSPSDHLLAQRPKRRAVRNTRVSKPTTEVRKLAQRPTARPASLAELN
ncbi:hypothetical protein QL285_067028 [Trifolium repens]|nr:hypothetical protein QL285_067028 [Trifolium repens]